LRVHCQLWENLEFKDGLLYIQRDSEVTGDTKLKLIAPQCIRDNILHQPHNTRCSGHLGRNRTTELVKKRLFWPRLTEDIKRWCKACNL